MTRAKSTRVVNGQQRPAYENAPLRIRQSQLDTWREFATERKRRSMVDDLFQLGHDARVIGEPGKAYGTLLLCAATSVMFMALLFAAALIFH